MSIPQPLGLLKPAAVVSKVIGIHSYLLLAMSPEVGDSRETLAYFLLYASPFPFNLWRCGRLVCFRLLFAGANNCLWQIIDFENKFSVAICQTQQSTIATASLGLLKPAEVVSKGVQWKNRHSEGA